MSLPEGYEIKQASHEDLEECLLVFSKAFKDDEFPKVIWIDVDSQTAHQYTLQYMVPRW